MFLTCRQKTLVFDKYRVSRRWYVGLVYLQADHCCGFLEWAGEYWSPTHMMTISPYGTFAEFVRLLTSVTKWTVRGCAMLLTSNMDTNTTSKRIDRGHRMIRGCIDKKYPVSWNTGALMWVYGILCTIMTNELENGKLGDTVGYMIVANDAWNLATSIWHITMQWQILCTGCHYLPCSNAY